MIGFAVSLYDKFNDLGVFTDIVRHNWDGDYYISVSSNHPDAREEIERRGIDIDILTPGAAIHYDPADGRNENFFYRVYDTIRKSCLGAMENDDIEFVMHVHADAWPLSEDGVTRLVQEAKDRDAAASFPSQTDLFVDGFPPGHVSDQFFLLEAAVAREESLFEYGPVELPPAGIHRLLPILCLVKFGWTGLYQYTNTAPREHWDGRSSTQIKSDARPMFHDPEYGQIHIAKEDFGEELGKKLQAYYLDKYDVDRGPFVEDLRDGYGTTEAELLAEIDDYIESLNDRMRPYGLSVEDFGRDFRLPKRFFEKDLAGKLKFAVYWNVQETAFEPLVTGAVETLKRLTGKSSYGGPYKRLPDQSINQYYRDTLDREDFPEELQRFYDDVYAE